MMLTLPRVAPIDAAALEHWLGEARHGARLNHPHLAPVAEVGVHEHWPYVACQRALGVTLAERLGAAKLPSHNESVGWLCQALEGLAFAHDAGIAHHDVQLHSLVIDEQGHVRVLALGAGATPTGTQTGVAMETRNFHCCARCATKP
jgi:serine/threonine protein kinase